MYSLEPGFPFRIELPVYILLKRTMFSQSFGHGCLSDLKDPSPLLAGDSHLHSIVDSGMTCRFLVSHLLRYFLIASRSCSWVVALFSKASRTAKSIVSLARIR